MPSIVKKIILVIAATALMSACANNGGGEKTSGFVYAISAAENINPDINMRPSSVVVRVYQLKNRVNFDNARYEDLFNPIKNTLGAEFIAVSEYLIDPGMSAEFDVDIASSTKFIGIAVGYRSIDMVNWRTIVAMPEKSALDPIGLFGGSSLQIIVDELSVRAVEL